MSNEALLAHAEPIRDGRIYGSLWLMLFSASLAKADADASLGWGIAGLLFWAVLFALALAAGHAQGKRPHPAYKQLGTLFAVMGLAAFLLTLGAGLTSALLNLLLWMQLAKSFTLANRRDLFFTVGVSFVLLLFAAAQSRSSLFLLYIVIYSLAGVYTLLLAHAESRRALAIGTLREAGGTGHFPASTVALTGGILLVAGLLYFLVPRPPAAHLGSYPDRGGADYRSDQWENQAKKDGQNAAPTDDAGEGEANSSSHGPGEQTGTAGRQRFDYSGFESSFDIDQPGQGRFANGIVLFVQAPHGLYLRGRVFDSFDGLRWSQKAGGTRKHLLERGQYEFPPFGPQGEEVHQIVEVEQNLSDMVFASPRLVKLGFPGTVVAEDRDGAIRIPGILQKGTRYEAWSRARSVRGHPATDGNAPADPSRYLQLPANFEPEIVELAHRVADGASDPMDKAIRLEQHLRTQYQYTLDTAFTSQNVTPLKKFLFETRRGHCEYFASAMTVMLRSEGIPARLVTGFSATNYNPLTGFYEVRALDGHAWVEAYFQEYGWVGFEPTAFYSLPQERQKSTTAQALGDYLDQLGRIDQAVKAEPGRINWYQEAATLFKQLGQILERLLKQAYDAALTLLAMLGPLVGSLLLVGALAGVAFHRLRVPLLDRLALGRLRRHSTREPGVFVVLCYRELEAWFARRGLPRHPAETVEEYTERLGREKPGAEREITALGRIFAGVRYGNREPTAEGATGAYHAFAALAKLEEKRAGG